MALGSLWPWNKTPNTSVTTNSNTISDNPSSRESLATKASDRVNSHATSNAAQPTLNDNSTTPLADRQMEKSIATMPETMSCSQAFDLAMGCGGLGGSFNGVYRYGHWRDCSKLWTDWRFCMSLGVHNAETKKQMIREHYWKKEQEFRAAPNSENIWEERDEKMTSFFERDPDADGLFEGHFARAPPELEFKT